MEVANMQAPLASVSPSPSLFSLPANFLLMWSHAFSRTLVDTTRFIPTTSQYLHFNAPHLASNTERYMSPLILHQQMSFGTVPGTRQFVAKALV